MADDHCYLVFARADRQQWRICGPSEDELSEALVFANAVVESGTQDRVCVMQVSGVDALPTFTLRYSTKAVS
jgi:hypothetical protein